jgi:FdhE protein
VLTLYLALLDVWDDAADRLREERPAPLDLPEWTVERVLPDVVKATEAAGPESLAGLAADAVEAGDLTGTLAAWLAGQELPPVHRYLARAALTGPLAALGEDAGAACVGDPQPRGGARCPRCGGAPQLSFRSDADDALVSGGRSLLCVRCGHSWSFSASSCPSCGESTGAKRTVYGERTAGPVVGRPDPRADTAEPGGDGALLPHLRVEACATCHRYLIDVDLARDPRAVPEVDELVALPLDLYAAEQGLSKITPNVMGF